MKITPKPKFKRQGVDFAGLEVGDYFLWNDMLLQKTNQTDNQEANDTKTGVTHEDMCGEYVRPVDVEIKWKRKEILR